MRLIIAALILMMAPTLSADPLTCTAEVDYRSDSFLVIHGPNGPEVFEFGLGVDIPATLSLDGCTVYGSAESTGTPFNFLAIYGNYGFDATPSDDPIWGTDYPWQSPSGNFRSLPLDFDFPTPTLFSANRGGRPVPEPPAWALTLAGAVALRRLRRKETP